MEALKITSPAWSFLLTNSLFAQCSILGRSLLRRAVGVNPRVLSFPPSLHNLWLRLKRSQGFSRQRRSLVGCGSQHHLHFATLRSNASTVRSTQLSIDTSSSKQGVKWQVLGNPLSVSQSLVEPTDDHLPPSPNTPVPTQDQPLNPPAPTSGDPEDGSNGVVFYDGLCGFCNASVRFVMHRDQAAQFKFAPLQGKTAAALLPAADRVDLNSVVVSFRGRLYYKTSAVALVLKNLNAPWPIAGWLLLLIPRPLRDWGYDVFAHRRYLVWGRHTTCPIPTPTERTRFLP